MKRFLVGQWKGTSELGSYCNVSIEQEGCKLNGRTTMYATFTVEGKPFPIINFSTFNGDIKNKGTISGNVDLPSIHYRNGDYLTDQDIIYLKEKIGFEFPTSTTFTAVREDKNKLNVKWKSIYPSLPPREDTVLLERVISAESKIPHEEMPWNKFREFALSQSNDLIYRGQSQPWMLQTAFHRIGRADIISYLDNQVPDLERHINSVSKHVFDVRDDRSLGALLNLAQHHGYPTPLLDWTKSPYVSAFFAFEDINQVKKRKHVSIFIFEDRKWAEKVGRVANIRAPNMLLRTLELPGFGNARVLPQQSVTMFSNVADIESLIFVNETTKGEFVKAIAIPSSDREKAMRDLSLMGITWGSLFPGLDGICRQLRSRHFGQ